MTTEIHWVKKYPRRGEVKTNPPELRI